MNCNNNNLGGGDDPYPQSEGVTLAMNAVKMATRKKTSLGLGMSDLRQALGLLVSLYVELTLARAPAPRVTMG